MITHQTTNRTKMSPRECTEIILYYLFTKVYGIYAVTVHELVKLLITVRELTHEATHNSSRTSVLTKLLITLREFVHKAAHNSSQTCSQAAHSTQKDCLCPFMPIYNTSL